MKILFFTHYFPPEVNAPANRTFEHCREWVAQGHEVHVITCVPSHPLGVPFHGFRSGWYQREERDGIVVHRVWTLLAPNAGVWRRTLNFLSFIPTAVWRAIRLESFDVMIGTSPQFFCAVATWFSAVLTRTPWIFELRDLWPDSITAVGAAKPYMPLALLERFEKYLYRHARGVVCVTKAFIANLASRGIDPGKLSFVPNGIDPTFWTSGSRERGRALLEAGDGEHVVSYIGTVGMAHDLGTVLSAARQLRDHRPDIRFVVVGAGAELQAIRDRAEADGLTNVRFTGLVPRESIPDYQAGSDIALVTLRRTEVFKTVLPSKMFEAMAAGRPIVLGVEGEAQALLERSGGGVAVTPGDPAAMADAVVALVDDPERRRLMGEAAGRFVQQEFCRQVWAGRYLRIIQETLGRTDAAIAHPSASSL